MFRFRPFWLTLAVAGLGTAAVAAAADANVPASATTPADLAAIAGWKGAAPNSRDAFSFVILSDRTGGHVPGEWEEAVAEANRLKPDFVICVGDLIEGYTSDRAVLEAQWQDVERIVSKLDAPFFYCPGNHDVTRRNPQDEATAASVYRERHGVNGRSYYSFDYRGCHFVVLNTLQAKDNPEFAREQFAWLRQDMQAAAAATQVFVFYHHPLWPSGEPPALWQELRTILPPGKTTIFNGHWHWLSYQNADGFPSYVLASSGAESDRNRDEGGFRMFARVAVDGARTTVSLLPLHEVLPGSFADDVAKRTRAIGWAGTTFEIGPAGGDLLLRPANLQHLPLDLNLSWRAPDWTVLPERQTVHLGGGEKAQTRFRLQPRGDHPQAPVLVAEHVLSDGRAFTREHRVGVWECTPLGALSAVEIDGRSGEWNGIPAASVGKPEQLFAGAGSWTGPADGSATLRAARCGDNLAIVIEVTDDAFAVDPAAKPWENDAVEFFWDTRRPADRDGKHGPGTGQLIVERQEKDGVPAHALWIRAGKTEAQLPASVKVFCRATAAGYVVEASLPLKELGATADPAKGDDLALELILDDRDGTGGDMKLKRLSGNGTPQCSSSTACYRRFRLP